METSTNTDNESVFTSSTTLETLKQSDCSTTNTDSLDFLNIFIKDAVEGDRLDHPIDESDSCDTSRILRLIDEYSDKDAIVKLIEEYRCKLLHNWKPKILTLGGFIFGCYYKPSIEHCFDDNISCDPICAFSIPKFDKTCVVCKANVMYVVDDTTNLYLNNNSDICYVYLKNTILKFHFTEKLINSLKEKNCKKALIIKDGRVIKTLEIDSNTTPCEIYTSEFPTSHIDCTDEVQDQCKKDDFSSSSSSSATQCESDDTVAEQILKPLFIAWKTKSEYSKFVTNIIIAIIILFIILICLLIYKTYYCSE